MVSQDMQGIKEANLKLKRVLLRLDLDVPLTEGKIADTTRLEETLPTVKWLLEAGAKIMVIGHLGRPEAANFKFQTGSQYSLKPVYEWYQTRLDNNPNFKMLENLRFDAGEERNSVEFAKKLVAETGAELYVFEAFAVSHRAHASVTQIPKILPTYAGMRFEKEIEMLQKVQVASSATRRRGGKILLIGGAKGETKIPLIKKLSPKFDQVLVGGRMPLEITQNPNCTNYTNQTQNSKIKLANLNSDGLDITEDSAREFAEIIKNAGVVVWNGPMGAYENTRIQDYKNIAEAEIRNTPAYGTYLVAKAMNETKAFTVAGGGDTEAALTKFDLEKAPLRQGFEGHGIDWISSGGGAMLTYLAEGTVAFLEG